MPNPDILELLRCPVTHLKLRMLHGDEQLEINKAIASRTLKNRGGQTVSAEIVEGLVNSDKSLAFHVNSAIIQLIADEAIVLGDIIQTT